MFRLLAVLGASLLGVFMLVPDQEKQIKQPAVARAETAQIVLAPADSSPAKLILAAQEGPVTLAESTTPKVFPPKNRVAKMTSAPLDAPMLAVSSSDAPAGYVAKNRAPKQAVAAVGSDNLRYVSGNSVNMRSGPSTSNAVIRALGRGAATELIGQENGWAHIRDLSSGDTGYMSAKFLSR